AFLIERADEVAGNLSVGRYGDVGPLRMLRQIPAEPTLAERRTRRIVGEGLRPAGFEEDRVELPVEAPRNGNVRPSPDGYGGADVGFVFGHHASGPARMALRTSGPDAEGAGAKSGPQLN